MLQQHLSHHNGFASNSIHGMPQPPFSCASSVGTALNHQQMTPCMDVENLDSTLLAQNMTGLDMDALLLDFESSETIQFNF